MVALPLLLAFRPGHAALELNIAVEPISDSGQAVVLNRYLPLSKYLGTAAGEEVKIIISQDLTDQLRRTRSAAVPLVLGPAHVVASAMKHGYQPLAVVGSDERMAIVVPKNSPIARFEDIKGKRIGLPPQDSLATYLYLGELNKRGIAVNGFQSEIRHHRLHEVALYTLGLGMVDAAAVDAVAAASWAKDNGGKVIFESQPVPGPTIAFNKTLPGAKQERIGNALLTRKSGSGDLGLAVIAEAKPAAYTYVATLGHFTPTVLNGAKIVSAEEARDLGAKGALLFDVRSEKEFRDAHPKGAIHLPYKESSKKEIGFDRQQDQFALADAAKDKNASLVLFCNGAECWKSYKASTWALQAGYKNIYWFRGGYPEWRDKRLPLEKSGP
jgi:ABC-type phosphate/phosphonate transport system substrate-binding protein/rhodanese-related sulfurtransferase